MVICFLSAEYTLYLLVFPNILFQKSLIKASCDQALALSQWQSSYKSVHAGFSPKSESSIRPRGSLEPFLLGFLISTSKELMLHSWESQVPNMVCNEHISFTFSAQVKRSPSPCYEKEIYKLQDIPDKTVVMWGEIIERMAHKSNCVFFFKG